MKTVLRVISKEGSEFTDIPNKEKVFPIKESRIVFKGESLLVSYTEFDFDNDTLYIVCIS